jgi:carbon storage regulator
MLVLSRKRDQIVELSCGVKVHVVDIRGDKVRLGFVAPDDIEIVRPDAKSKAKKPRPANPGPNAAHAAVA